MKILKVILPLAIVAAGALLAAAIVKSKTEIETTRPDVPPPLVRVVTARATDTRLDVTAHGSVRPRTESTLTAKVGGRVVEVAPAFERGGFFESNDLLVRIDAADYELAVARAQAQVAQADLRLAREEAESDLAKKEWQSFGKGDGSALALRAPQLAEAKAALAAAQATLQQSRYDLESTKLRAPYAGRLWDKFVDVGQVVAPGTPLARVYAVDYAEIRLPLADDQLAFLDLPLDYRGETGRPSGPEVVLRATFAGTAHEWKGRIVRTEAEIDPKTRMIHAIARVDDPYGRKEPGRPPLLVGLFLEATLRGREVKGVILLPRAAVREDGRIAVVDREERLRLREVKLLRLDARTAIVKEGLQPGERVCVSALDLVVDGMAVRTAEGP